MIIDVNGKISEDNASISVLNAGYYFGFGIYETLLIQNSIAIFYEKHMQRLHKALKYFDIKWMLPAQEDLKERIAKIINYAKCDEKNNYRLRILISPGEVAFPNIDFTNINSVLFLSKIKEDKSSNNLQTPETIKLYFNEKLKKSSSVFLPSYIKLTSNNKNLMSARKAAANNCHQALLSNDKGIITEGSFSNFFFIKENNIYTSDTKNNLLEGITRSVLFEIVPKNDINITTGNYTIEDVLKADAAFITSSTKGVVKVESILTDKKLYSFNDHELINRLKKLYSDHVNAYILNQNS